jgi:transcriptional regulator with XRE-family HTH domain
MPQREMARRSGVSQSLVSRVLRGVVLPDLGLMVRLADSVGHRLSFKLHPQDGLSLRDSGQLGLAEVIRGQAHRQWKVRLEIPVARPPDRRAGDMLLDQPIETNLIEIERGLHDFQAQLRAAQLKRLALAELLGRRVNLVIGVPDTAAARRSLAPHAALIATALPVGSRRAWSAIRSGESISGDALIWIRPRAISPDAAASSGADGSRPATRHAGGASPGADGSRPATRHAGGASPGADGSRPATRHAGGASPGADASRPATRHAGGASSVVRASASAGSDASGA